MTTTSTVNISYHRNAFREKRRALLTGKGLRCFDTVFGDHTQLFQLAFRKSSLSRIDVKFTQVIGFRLKIVLI